jgi:hypothetical protein
MKGLVSLSAVTEALTPTNKECPRAVLVKNGLPFRIAERCGFLLRSPRRVSFSFPTKKAPLKGIKRSAEYSTLRNTRQSGEKVEREPARKDGRGMKSSDLLPAFLNGNGPNRRIRLVR